MRDDDGQLGPSEAIQHGVAPQRARRWAPIALGIMAGLALCGLGYLTITLFNQPTPDVAPTARAICADLTAQRYDSLYSLLSSDLQAQGTPAQFVASQRELDRLLGPVHACSVSATSVGGGAGELTLAMQRERAIVAHVSLTQTSRNWRIASYDQTV